MLRAGLYFLAKEMKISNPDFVMGVNPSMRDQEVVFYDQLLEKMQQRAEVPKIEVAEGLEDICEHCPDRSSCDNEDSIKHDRIIADIINVEIGKEYSPNELVDILKSFYNNALSVYSNL